MNNTPDSNCQEPVPLPDAVWEFTVDISLPKFVGFVDASFGSELQKWRSITGCVFAFSRGSMACKSETQNVTASSSTEAEIIAAFTSAKAAQHLRFILQELGFPQDRPTEIHVDNQAALQITNDDQAPTIGTQHLDVRFFSLQDCQEEGGISMVHIVGVLDCQMT